MPEADYNKMPFEEALTRLEEIVAGMEEGDLSLEEMIKRYEEGNLLARLCSGRLKAFSRKIEILSGKNADEGQWEEFDPESGGRGAPVIMPETGQNDTENGNDLLF